MLTRLARAVAWRKGWVVRVRDDRWHRRPTALLGGVALLAGTLLPPAVAGQWPGTPSWLAFALGAVGMGVLGLVDDLVHLRPGTKLGAQIALAVVPVALGLGIPGLPRLVAVPLALLWIVGITNAMNLLDNMDGLAAGVAAVAAAALALHGWRWGDGALLAVSSALAGACVGFLIFNFPRASIFMGDAGSLFLGYSLGVLALLGLQARASPAPVALVVPVFVLLVPLFDTTLVTVLRIAAGRRVSQGGRDHASHRLVRFGLSERNAVITLWTITALGGALSLTLGALPGWGVVLLAEVTAGLLLLLGAVLAEQQVYEPDPGVDGGEPGQARPPARPPGDGSTEAE